GLTQLATTLPYSLGEMLADAVGDEEARVLRPAVGPLRLAHLLLAQRLAVSGTGVLLSRRAIADMAVHHHQRGPVLLLAENLEGAGHHLQVVGVADARHVPAVAQEARRHVVAERQRGGALDGDVVVVLDPAEVAQLQVAG